MNELLSLPYRATSEAAGATLAGMTTTIEPPMELGSASLAKVYRELRDTLLGFLVKQTGDAHAAEDLLHDVMLKVLTGAREGKAAPENIGGWLYTVARNAAIDWHRARRPSDALPEDLAAPEDDEDDTGLELANCLRPMAERLPQHYRDAVVAADIDGRPLKQVATEQGISLAAAKTRASRARKLLQQELIACCRVVLSESGQVQDYDTRAAQTCASETASCHSSRKSSCRG